MWTLAHAGSKVSPHEWMETDGGTGGCRKSGLTKIMQIQTSRGK